MIDVMITINDQFQELPAGSVVQDEAGYYCEVAIESYDDEGTAVEFHYLHDGTGNEREYPQEADPLSRDGKLVRPLRLVFRPEATND